MNVYRGRFENAEDADAGRGVGLGNFDGIHAGHAALIEKLILECAKRDLRSMIYTFENHPNHVICKDKPTPLILSEERKIKTLEETGVDELFLEYFDEEYAHTAPEEFVKKILVGRLHAKIVVVGYDYTYGDRGRGTSEELVAYGEKYGFTVFVVPPVRRLLPCSGELVTVSSTILRKLIQEGKMHDFRALTGRYYTIPGRVIQGRNVGKTLGFPTANIIPKEGFALPCFGVYATITKAGGKTYRSITNVGNNPTFQNITAVTIETHIIGFKGDLYGHDIEVEFIKKMRGEIAFPSAEELMRQLRHDLDERKTMSEGMKKVYEKGGVEIYHIPADKFKTSVVRILLCDNLSKEHAYQNALIPAILNAGCEKYPTMRQISGRLQELYGAGLTVGTSSLGEIQYSEFLIEYTARKYAADYPELERDVIAFLFELITNPVTEEYNGKKGFVGSVFERERTNRDHQIRSLINDKHAYAQRRCTEIMCEGEPYAVYQLGDAGDGDGLTPSGLYDYYRKEYLAKSRVKIFFCGETYPEELTAYAQNRFPAGGRVTLHRAYVEKREIPETNIKYAEEKMNVTQGKLFLGYRTNTPPESSDYYAAALCGVILGQGTQSKLFVNIREKHSLAYYAAAYTNKMKGILFAFCAIDPKDRAVAEALIREQVAAIRNGEITTEEYEAAVKLLRNDLASYGDSQSQLLQYYFGQTFMEQIADPDEYARHIAEVSVEDIVKAAGRMTLDTVYFLTSEDEA